MNRFKHKWIISAIALLIATGTLAQKELPLLKVSANKRFFVKADNTPFFWMGDTGWLLFVKLKREEAIQYLEDRKKKGFNVIQVMLVHDIKLGVNAYGDSALHNNDVSMPATTPGNSFSNKDEYDFWDHVDFVIGEAAKRGIYMALVPVWGGNVKYINEAQAKVYATFLANRYKNRTNIIWLNGGDIKGSDGITVWKMIGNTIRSIDKDHLIGFHPRGRNSSSIWFHNEPWLDFNMFQSGHRSYAQDTSSNETLHYGEDNWRYVKDDYALKPVKPTFDGEPSYEGIPYGLHDSTQPYWKNNEVRRYAYWSVFAGGCGFTYGNNSVMQFYAPGDAGTSFFPKEKWQDGLQAPGSYEMRFLKQLMLSKPYLERIPDDSMVVDNGEKYDHIAATRGSNYAMFYVYSFRPFQVAMGKLKGKYVRVSWFNPEDGSSFVSNKKMLNKGIVEFKGPFYRENAGDWVLILEGYGN